MVFLYVLTSNNVYQLLYSVGLHQNTMDENDLNLESDGKYVLSTFSSYLLLLFSIIDYC